MTDKLFRILCLGLLFSLGIPPYSSAQIRKTDTVDRVVRGRNLISKSPVCYYYDLLSHDIPKYDVNSYFFPSIVFVSGWGKWVVSEDKDGQDVGIVVTDTVPNSIAQDNKEYFSYLYKSKLKVKVDDDILEIESFEASSNDPYLTIKAKLFSDSKNDTLLGITYSYYGRYVGSEGAFYFYSFKGNKWEDVTANVLLITDTSIFFGDPIDIKLMRKYIYLGIYADFYANSDTVKLLALNMSDLNCEDDPKRSGITIKRADKEKLYDNFASLKRKGVDYVLDRRSFKFKRATNMK